MHTHVCCICHHSETFTLKVLTSLIQYWDNAFDGVVCLEFVVDICILIDLQTSKQETVNYIQCTNVEARNCELYQVQLKSDTCNVGPKAIMQTRRKTDRLF